MPEVEEAIDAIAEEEELSQVEGIQEPEVEEIQPESVEQTEAQQEEEEPSTLDELFALRPEVLDYNIPEDEEDEDDDQDAKKKKKEEEEIC